MIERMMFNRPIPIQPDPIYENRQNQKNQQVQGETRSFSDLLKEKIGINDSLHFSAHASQRLQQRNILLSESDHLKLTQAVDKIAEKGGRESLIVMNEVSYLVNVPNRTVITAMDLESAKDNVFTNIDSTMIL
ncbi:MAG: flagellar protein [Candidatus Cloacimonetes bacterium]|nr:flagellar protein [Candidatus Cloacimonadota bacterium]